MTLQNWTHPVVRTLPLACTQLTGTADHTQQKYVLMTRRCTCCTDFRATLVVDPRILRQANFLIRIKLTNAPNPFV